MKKFFQDMCVFIIIAFVMIAINELIKPYITLNLSYVAGFWICSLYNYYRKS